MLLVGHAFNPSTMQVEAGGLLWVKEESFRQATATQWDHGFKNKIRKFIWQVVMALECKHCEGMGSVHFISCSASRASKRGILWWHLQTPFSITIFILLIIYIEVHSFFIFSYSKFRFYLSPTTPPTFSFSFFFFLFSFIAHWVLLVVPMQALDIEHHPMEHM